MKSRHNQQKEAVLRIGWRGMTTNNPTIMRMAWGPRAPLNDKVQNLYPTTPVSATWGIWFRWLRQSLGMRIRREVQLVSPPRRHTHRERLFRAVKKARS